MTEEAQAREIANRWLEFQMNPLVQMVPGDPDCDACVLARQYLRAVTSPGQDRPAGRTERQLELIAFEILARHVGSSADGVQHDAKIGLGWS